MGLLKGSVVNHSNIDLLVIETTTNHPNGPAIAHRLSGRRKSPKNIDADGFKRLDGKPIDGHAEWWKILDFSTADIYQDGDKLKVSVAYKGKVPDQQFKAYLIDKGEGWGDPLKIVTAIYKSKTRQIVGYEVEGVGRVDRQAAISLAERGDLDNVVLAQPAGTKYLRTKPDQNQKNNLREIIVV